MSDLISREDIPYIDLNSDMPQSKVRVWVAFKEQVDVLPSADAVEVVRCRDCIHWFPHTQCGFDEDNDEYHDYCGLLIPDDDYYAFRRKSDDYCSYGKRREDGEDD